MTGTTTLLDGRYSLDEEIGAGGFCTVWRGTDTVLARPVAVKVLHGGYVHQPEARARFKAEARHAGAVSHQNIARVYDYGEPPTGPSYLVMELIEGPSLAGVLRLEPGFPAVLRAAGGALGDQAADGLLPGPGSIWWPAAVRQPRHRRRHGDA